MATTLFWIALGIFVVITWILFLRPNHILTKEIAKSRATVPESQFIDWKGSEIHYTEEGQGDTVLMIHGLGGSFHNFEEMKNEMKDQYRVIRVDLPGMGLSDFNHIGDDTNFLEEYLDFFLFFIEQKGLDNFYVMGNSLGGMMAWMMAEVLPEKVKGLVLFNSAGYDVSKVIVNAAGPMRWRWFAPVLKKGVPTYFVKLALPYLFGDKKKITQNDIFYADTLINTEGTLTTVNMLSSNTSQAPDSALIKNIKTPTLIIWGKEDKIIPVEHADRFVRDLTHTHSIIYSPCGHMAMMEFPKEAYREFELFFNQKEITA